VRTRNPPLIESTLLQLSCPLEVPIGHECQLCLVLAIGACPRQGETPLRLRAIIRAHRHTRILRLPRLTMRECQTRCEIYVNCDSFGRVTFRSRAAVLRQHRVTLIGFG
jgi:hypothetical protein